MIQCKCKEVKNAFLSKTKITKIKMLFRKRAIASHVVLDTKRTPSKEEACKLLEEIKDNQAIISETPKKGVFKSFVIAFFILISVAGLLSLIEKTLINRNIVKIQDNVEHNLLVDSDDIEEDVDLLSSIY